MENYMYYVFLVALVVAIIRMVEQRATIIKLRSQLSEAKIILSTSWRRCDESLQSRKNARIQALKDDIEKFMGDEL